MSGARPLYLSAAFILEEGLPVEDLRRIVESMRASAAMGSPTHTKRDNLAEHQPSQNCELRVSRRSSLRLSLSTGRSRLRRSPTRRLSSADCFSN